MKAKKSIQKDRVFTVVEKCYRVSHQKQKKIPESKRVVNGNISIYKQDFSPYESSNILNLPLVYQDTLPNISLVPATNQKYIIVPQKISADEFQLLQENINKLINQRAVIVSCKAATKLNAALVTEAIVFSNKDTYFRCPNCQNTMEREYQKYCDRCGQKLKWQSLKKLSISIYNTYIIAIQKLNLSK